MQGYHGSSPLVEINSFVYEISYRLREQRASDDAATVPAEICAKLRTGFDLKALLISLMRLPNPIFAKIFIRRLGVCALAGGLIALGVTHAKPQANDLRKLVKTDWPRMPAKVNHGKLKKGPARFGESFSDPDDDWLDGFTINLQNTSTKSIVYIGVGLTFFDKEEGLVPERVPVAFPFSYGSGLGILTGRTFQPVKPGESVDVVFSSDQFLELKSLLVKNNYPPSFHQVDVCVEAIQFDDGELWYKSYIFYRDPYDPNRYVRDKFFQKGGKYENIKPGTFLGGGD